MGSCGSGIRRMGACSGCCKRTGPTSSVCTTKATTSSRGASPEMSHVGRCHRRRESSRHATPAHAHRRRWQKIATEVRARYHAAMQKSTLKLVIHRETIRALSQLELVRVAAGANPDAQLMDTEGPATGCPLAQAAAQPAKP